MAMTHVRDLMLPLGDVPTVHQDANLVEALRILKEAQASRPEGRLPFRVMLVVDDQGKVVGKIGHYAFLRALSGEGLDSGIDRDALDRACVDPVLVDSISGHLRFLEESFEECCSRVAQIGVCDAMFALGECVDENAPLVEAVHLLVRLQTLSILVCRGSEIVGLLRLADVFDDVARRITGGG